MKNPLAFIKDFFFPFFFKQTPATLALRHCTTEPLGVGKGVTRRYVEGRKECVEMERVRQAMFSFFFFFFVQMSTYLFI